jgi:hypothetical protein
VIDVEGAGEGTCSAAPVPTLPGCFISDLNEHDFSKLATPAWVFLESTATGLFQGAAKMAARLSTPDIKITNAYSIKTNPDERLIRLAYESGFMAEASSPIR